jgi:hypothetical protein
MKSGGGSLADLSSFDKQVSPISLEPAEFLCLPDTTQSLKLTEMLDT